MTGAGFSLGSTLLLPITFGDQRGYRDPSGVNWKLPPTAEFFTLIFVAISNSLQPLALFRSSIGSQVALIIPRHA